MNWAYFRAFPWLDTRARFVAAIPRGGALLDMGSSNGETLHHFVELRPDLRLFSVDVVGEPEKYPAGCEFHRADLERDALPWPPGSMDAITCLHLIEHLDDLSRLIAESCRVLKPGGRIYFESPHPRTLTLSSPSAPEVGVFPLNFFDDLSHVRPVAMGALAQHVRRAGLQVIASGTSRNWLFALSYPCFACLPASRQKFTARMHWVGWSAFLIAARPS